MNIELHGNFDSLLAHRKLAFSESIASLYEVFHRYKLPDDMSGCDHCVFPEDVARLRSKPLRKLTPQDLEKYARKALTTWGDTKGLRHFLPRICELMDELDAECLDSPIITGKLTYGHWRKWPKQEQTAIERFLDCRWGVVLAEYPPAITNADSALCTAAQALDDLTPILTQWGADDTLPAVGHLADFIEESVYKYCKKGELSDAFWGYRKVQLRQVLDWLQSQKLRDRIESLFFSFQSSQPSLGAALSESLQTLEALRVKVERFP